MQRQRHSRRDTTPTNAAVTTPGRVYGYCRVSSDAQGTDGTSLAQQEEEIRRHCTAHRLPDPIVSVEVETGAAGPEVRVELGRLLAAVRTGDTVLVARVDRWSRDLPWGVSSVRDLVRRGVRWVAIMESIDASTPSGDSQLGIMSWVADQERARIRARTVGARQRLRAMGHHVEGQAPLGYAVVERRLVVDPAGAAVVRRAFALAPSMSVRDVSATLRREFPDVPGLDHAAVVRRLRDRRYIGESCTRGSRRAADRATAGEWRPTHEAIVDPATFAAVGAAIDRRRVGGRPPSGEARVAGWLVRGIARCHECGHVLRSQAQMPGRSGPPGWYACIQSGCAMRHARQDMVDKEIERLVLARLATLGKHLAKPTRASSPRRDPHANERARHVRRLANLVSAVADGTLTHDIARAQIREAEDAIRQIDASRAVVEPPVDRSAVLARVDGIAKAWGGMTIDERREAIHLLAARVVLYSTATRKWQRNAWEVRITWRELATDPAGV